MTESKQDTITVELPIRPMLNGDVKASSIRLTRRGWREAANGGGDWGDIVRAAAPAVVAWIERDEFVPLDVPDKGRTIKATLRDGSVETFEVGAIGDGHHWTWVQVGGGPRSYPIERVLDKDGHDPEDIIAWEYVDEPAVDLAAIADKIAAAVTELREAIIATTGEGDSNG